MSRRDCGFGFPGLSQRKLEVSRGIFPCASPEEWTEMASVEPRGDKIKAIVSIGNKRHSKTFHTLADAKLWARAQERARDIGDVAALPSSDTLASVIDQYQKDDGDWG